MERSAREAATSCGHYSTLSRTQTKSLKEHEAFSVNEKNRGTVQGILAMLFWGSTIAFSRSLAEELGTLTAASYIFLLAGGLSCTFLIVSRRLQAILRAPATYLFGCGTIFVVYMTSLYLAIGTATNRLQVLEVGLVNYLWPSLTLVMAVPILGRKARVTLIPGCLLGFAGVLLASAQSGESWRAFVGNLGINWSPYMLAFVAAVCWALYSNLTRRWARGAERCLCSFSQADWYSQRYGSSSRKEPSGRANRCLSLRTWHYFLQFLPMHFGTQLCGEAT